MKTSAKAFVLFFLPFAILVGACHRKHMPPPSTPQQGSPEAANTAKAQTVADEPAPRTPPPAPKSGN